MKDLRTYISESFIGGSINEKFGSDFAGKLFKGIEAIGGRESSWLKHGFRAQFMRILPWDKLTERDFDSMSASKAYQMYRKFNPEDEREWNVIIWMGSGDEVIAMTLGKSIVAALDKYDDKISRISKDAKQAYVLNNPKVLKDVSDLQDSRFRSRDNAYALDSDEYISFKNNERYQKALKELRRVGDIGSARYLETMSSIIQSCREDVVDIYDDAYERVRETDLLQRDNPEYKRLAEQFGVLVDLMNKLSSTFNNALWLTDNLSGGGDANQYKEYVNEISDIADQVRKQARVVKPLI